MAEDVLGLVLCERCEDKHQGVQYISMQLNNINLPIGLMLIMLRRRKILNPLHSNTQSKYVLVRQRLSERKAGFKFNNDIYFENWENNLDFQD